MATTRVRYVDTDSAGGDGTTATLSGTDAAYASLQAALDGEASDISLATGSDEIVEIRCKASAGAADTSVTISQAGWQTEAGNYILITVQSGEEHGGVWDASKYRIVRTAAAGGTAIAIGGGDGTAHVRIQGLQVSTESTHNSGHVALTVQTGITDGTSDIRVSKCLMRLNHQDATDDLSASFIRCLDGDPTYRFWNNIIFVASTSAHNSVGNGIEIFSGATAYVYNNTVAGFATGYATSSALVAKNNVGDGNTTDFGSLDAASDFNASSDATAPGGNSRTSQTFTFQGTDDYRLASSDAGAKDFGTDLSADVDLAFSDDIAGTTRPVDSVWDIGAFEAATDGGGGAATAAGGIGRGLIGGGLIGHSLIR